MRTGSGSRGVFDDDGGPSPIRNAPVGGELWVRRAMRRVSSRPWVLWADVRHAAGLEAQVHAGPVVAHLVLLLHDLGQLRPDLSCGVGNEAQAR